MDPKERREDVLDEFAALMQKSLDKYPSDERARRLAAYLDGLTAENASRCSIGMAPRTPAHSIRFDLVGVSSRRFDLLGS